MKLAFHLNLMILYARKNKPFQEIWNDFLQKLASRPYNPKTFLN
jgi:hypothetical protein